MDYSLQSLKDAFTDAAYKESRRGYKLYVVLLATTLDQRFLAEYMSLFNELHGLTGDDVLVMGVRPGHEVAPDETPVWVRKLKPVAAVLRRRGDSGVAEEDRAEAEHFVELMRVQTTESYALARFLGVRTDQFPAMVFFADLERPSEMVVWPLGDITGEDFAKQLRHLLEEVRERGAWREMKSIPTTAAIVKDLSATDIADYNHSLPQDCREAAKSMNKLRNALAEHRRALRVYEKIDELRAAFEELRAMPELRVPLANVGETIADIEHGGFGHVVAHERRWRSRLPGRYCSAVAALKGASLTIGFSTKPFPPREEIAATIATLGSDLATLEEEHQGHRIAALDRKVAELERAQSRVRSAPPVLSVIEEVLRIRSCPLGRGAPPRAAFEHTNARAVPRAFISYSHDSAAHAAAVLELAQRLRGDGIDCWIDQFESSPAAGFPRWMQQQIGVADYVLLVCSETYCKRFNGAEQAGKGLGATFEGHLILQELYDGGVRNDRFVPILLPGGTPHDVPAVLRASKWYELPHGYELLRRRLLGSDAVTPVEVGTALGT